MKIADIITSALPVMVFASIASLFITIHIDTLKTIASMVICVFFANAGMLVIYNLLVLVLAKKNPLSFSKHASSTWFNAFVLCSSNASMPHTMDVCDKELGISSKVYSFSIPLGATINMDGLSVTLTISSVLLNQFGLPAGALAIFIGLNSFLDPFITANNVFGDVTGTYVISARSGLLKGKTKI